MTPVEKVARDLDYETPGRILAPVREYFARDGYQLGIPLDPATTEANPTHALTYFTPATDGLALPWADPVFVNPPYGKELRAWLVKIRTEVDRKRDRPILALLPAARWEQGYWQELLTRSQDICFVRKRVAFLRPGTGKPAKGNPYASLLVGFNTRRQPFQEVFRWLGICLNGHEGWARETVELKEASGE